MYTEKVKRHLFVLILLWVTFLTAVAEAKNDQVQSGQIVVTDLAGRKVSMALPAEKMVLGYAKQFPSIAAISGEFFWEKIVGWGLSRSARGQGAYCRFKEKYPGIETVPDVGNHAQGTFSVEKVISLKPDVVIFPLWVLNNQYEGTLDDINRMERAGIPTVFIDCWENPFENTIPSILLLGRVLGKENRAGKIADFCRQKIENVNASLIKISRKRPKVYIENGSRGSADYGFTCGAYAWGNMVDKAGGMNIAHGIVKRWGQINPEYLLKTSPDTVIIAEPRFPGSDSVDCLPNSEEAKKLLTAFTLRLGWDTLSAVKNGRVYGVLDSYIIYNIYNFAAFEVLAKWFHPYEFKELDPEADLKEFFTIFTSVDYDGRWISGIQD